MKHTALFVFISWLLAAFWTFLLCYLMLSPGTESTAGDLSSAFGGTDWTDALGHVALTFIETMLLTNLIRLYFPVRRALTLAAGLTLVLSATLEFAQRWIPDRGTSILDFAANAAGVALFAAVVLYLATRADQSVNRA